VIGYSIAAGKVGERVGAQHGHGFARDLQLKREELPSPKSRERPAINGTQLKRRDLDTFLIFALHLKFPPVLPGKPSEVTASEHRQKQTSQASNCCASSSLGKSNLGSGRCAGLRLGQDKGL
jgi:hypothetical protein